MEYHPLGKVLAILKKHGFERETPVGESALYFEGKFWGMRGYRNSLTGNHVSLDITSEMHPQVYGVFGWGQADPVFKDLAKLGWITVKYLPPVEETHFWRRLMKRLKGRPVVDRGFVIMSMEELEE